MPQLSALSHVGLKKEVTLGTYLAPTAIYVPTEGPVKPEDLYERVDDDSFDANATLLRGVYDGVRDGKVDWSGHLYPDIVGNYLVALGLADTVTGAGPYTHAFKNPAAGGQPPSWSITDFNTVEARGWVGMMLAQLAIKIDSKGSVKYDVNWKGWKSSAQSTPTPAFSAVAPFLGWQAQFSFGGAASTKVVSGEITVSRPIDTIHTLQNLQDPKTTFAGVLAAHWKFRALFEVNTELNYYLNNTQAAVQCALTAPGGGSNPVLTLLSTLSAFKKGVTDRGGNWAVVDIEGDGIYSATDQGPIQATLLNGVSSAY